MRQTLKSLQSDQQWFGWPPPSFEESSAKSYQGFGLPCPTVEGMDRCMRRIKMAAVIVVLAVLSIVALSVPRTRSLREGYADTFFPRTGHRYLIAPDGIKKVGQEVLDYQLTNSVVTGTVRRELEHDDIRTFRLDLKTHEVKWGEKVPNVAH